MGYGLSIIFLNGKYKMFGISKEVQNTIGNPDILQMLYSRERQELILCKGEKKHYSCSMKDTEETKDFLWVLSDLFVSKMEDEMCIFRDCVAVCLHGQFDDIDELGASVRFDLSCPTYAVLGFDNMPPTIETHCYPRYMHLYQNTFRI